MNTKHRSRRAFSLVEILFAVIIIGVLTAVAIPSLFSQKGKADDSNAKQTLRAALTLVQASTDDSGALQATSASGLITFLQDVDKNIQFIDGASALDGNVRKVSLYVAGDVVKMAALGGKTKGGYNCFAISYDVTGSNATVFYKNSAEAKTSCTAGSSVPTDAGTGTGGTKVEKFGDFSTK